MKTNHFRLKQVDDDPDSVRPTLEFDATQPLTSRSRHAFADEDDPALTAFVTSLWEELFSTDTQPVPSCPHCCGAQTRLHLRPNRHMRLPQFKCFACKRLFTRRTGSPMAGLRHENKMPAFIRLLSQAIPLEEASRRLGLDYDAVALWLMRFRQLIEQHDPEKFWATCVTLGLQYKAEGTCPRCSYSGPLLSGGFGGGHRRRAKCPQCSRIWPLGDHEAGTRVKVSIVRDPAISVIERRRREGLATPALTAAGGGMLSAPPSSPVVNVSMPEVPSPQFNRFDFAQPLRSNSPLPRHYIEDTQLTTYLRAVIARTLSDEVDPIPPCPHCASGDTWFVSRQRDLPRLPVYHCGNCERSYTRVTRTALANSSRREMLDAFLPWLSQQRPMAHAAEAFDATPETIKGIVKRFRVWLLRLDPSGEYERRVKLGLKTPWPVLACTKCGREAPAKPQGFARRKSIEAGQLRLFRCSACEGFFTLLVRDLPS
ncbi:DUF746 domain-containing protein [Burkholderia cepacia]|uniref:DUF746 domain-containing protein n=1 Tax=Burkholderia cepacia TaxID=292 RepID=UPI002AB7868C|nr:DUF746 domain-containing protein [Burkholderia cepacia]